MAIFTVTNLFDSGAGSLRNAIFDANTASTTDIIDFDTSLSGGTISLTSGELGITDNLTINGLGADLLSVDAGGNPFRIFNVDDGNSVNDLEVAINGLTITGGNPSGFNNGGGILNYENLMMTNSTISGNSADYGGGGIGNYSNLTITNSTISGNTQDTGGSNAVGGGGIYNNFTGTLTVINSTISGNTATDSGGGGIYNGRSLTVINSTISGNTATDGSGGGIQNSYAILEVTNSTISSNTARFGGGIDNTGGVTVRNSTISGNTAELGGSGINSTNTYGESRATVTSSIIAANTDDKDIEGDPFTSGGNNLIGNGDGAPGLTNGVNGDLVGTAANPIDPLLGELQDNGGPTQTQALLPGSLAINAGSNPLNLEFDQRGPGFNRVVGAQTDVGAYEVPEPDSTLGILGVAVLGVVLFCKRQQRRHT